MFVQDFVDEFARHRLSAEKAIAQVDDQGLNRILAPDGNSIAMLMRHVGGNLTSRFTDFLTSDGEKPWRHRDAEFADGPITRASAQETWTSGWTVLERELGRLGDTDLTRRVTIRGEPRTVHEALCRALAHIASHVGQIILIARVVAPEQWKWISIPKGQSEQYNQNPTLEKRPAT
jgi:hypothetical protein